MGQQNLAAPTIRAYISGVRQLQIARGFPDPNVGSMPRLRQILKGVAVIRGRLGAPSAGCLSPQTFSDG